MDLVLGRRWIHYGRSNSYVNAYKRKCVDTSLRICVFWVCVNVLAIAARKGGSGKTTLAAHLAVEAEQIGAGPVMLMDLDPQQSLTAWWNDRREETPKLMEVSKNRMKSELVKASRAKGLVILDTPPLDSQAITAVIDIADLIVIPVNLLHMIFAE